ncbi:MAG: hypothetical protein ABGX16_05100 [Pirellulales bacterium]
MKTVWQLLSVGLLMASYASVATAQSIIFQENFGQLPLRGPVDEESSITKAFTHIPPDGWDVDSSGVPGTQNPSIGVFEWEGWSFANKDYWIEVSNDEGRSQFTHGEGTVAVADPDEWNDRGDPANEIGFYNAFLETPYFDIGSILNTGSRLQFQLDSSWRPQCCDDGEAFAPNENNQTATILARFEDGSTEELLRWESAPFFFLDPSGSGVKHPSTNPADTPNPFFESIDLNKLLFVDLSSLLFSTHSKFKIEFGLSNAGDDFWWAMDNMQMISLTWVEGDMDLGGFLDENDIDDFAQAMHSTEAYRADHFDELPALRGSPDATFDFDDIDWFVNLLNGGGIAASRDTIIAAINAQAIPEPSSVCLAAMMLGVAFTRRQHSL